MTESFFALRLVNLRSVTCYTDHNFNENAHFGALNLFTSEKRLKLSDKTSINLEDLDFDFVLQHFKLKLVPRFSLLLVERPWLGLVTWSQNKINSEGGVLCLSNFFVWFVFTVHAMIERARQIC